MPTILNSTCVLVIGATSGIGRALARALHKLPSQPTVIAAGRRTERLNDLVEEGNNQGGRLKAIQVDLNAGNDKLDSFVEQVVSTYPQLDAVIFSSGIQHCIDFTNPSETGLSLLNDELITNYVATLRLIYLFMPHLLKIGARGQPAFIIPISSWLAAVPIPRVPGYCATKAAIHSLCITLRLQLKEKNVHVIEILPPLVESELHDHQGLTPMLAKHWMPLENFTEATMQGLLQGDREIFPLNEESYEKFEKGKIETVEAVWSRMKN